MKVLSPSTSATERLGSSATACIHRTFKIDNVKRPLSLRNTHKLHSQTHITSRNSRRFVLRATPESEDDFDDDLSEQEEAYEEDEYDDLIDEDFSGVTIETNDSKEFLLWEEYMAKNLEPSPLSNFADNPESLATNTTITPTQQTPSNHITTPLETNNVDDTYHADTFWNSPDPAISKSAAARFFGGKSLPLGIPQDDTMTEWDHRAAAEKKQRMDKEREEWLAHKENTLGKYSAVASDWRNDARIKGTGDPTQPHYREWSMKEIWDLITLGGKSIDPRSVPHKVHQPGSKTDFVAEGFVQQLEIPDWLAEQGKILKEEDENDIVDRDTEVALLSSEFDNFDDFGGMNLAGEQGSADSNVDDAFGGAF